MKKITTLIARDRHFTIIQNDEGFYLDRQPVKVDEAFGVRLVVHVVFAEGGELFAVQRVVRPHARFDDVSFIQFEPYLARNVFLRRRDESRKRFP